MNNYKSIMDQLIRFRDERNWQQFHNSKDLALALSIEASELNELFLWKNNTEEVDKNRLKEELADVLSYAFYLAEKNQLNIFDIMADKIEANGRKYPVEKAKNTAKKYTEL